MLLLFIQGEGGIRLDISGITDFGESIEGGDEACLGRAHLRPDTHCDDHRYTAKWKRGQLRDTRGFPHLAKTAPMPRCCSRCQALAIEDFCHSEARQNQLVKQCNECSGVYIPEWSGGRPGDIVPPHGDLKQEDGHKFEVSFVDTQFQARLSDRMRTFLRKKKQNRNKQ